VTLENSPSKVAAADQPLIQAKPSQAKLLGDHLRDVMQEAGVLKRYIEIPYPIANAPFSSSGFLLVSASAAGSEMVWSELACLHKPPSIASLGAQRRSWIGGWDKTTRRANHQKSVHPFTQKYSAFTVGQITDLTPRVSPDERGVEIWLGPVPSGI
jgi:hypothetical protein